MSSRLVHLDRSNLTDCRLLFTDLQPFQYSPWNWASKQVVRFMPDTGSVLDIASGHGNTWIMRHFDTKQYHLDLLDFIAPPDGPLPERTTYTRCDLDHELPPFEDEFDCIVSVSSLEHIREDRMIAVLEWVRDHIKPGGLVALTFGHLMGIRDLVATRRKLLEHPYFVAKGYGAYPPLNFRKIFEALGISYDNLPRYAYTYPGFELYDDVQWHRDLEISKDLLCLYPELAQDQDLAHLSTCEILVVFRSIPSPS